MGWFDDIPGDLAAHVDRVALGATEEYQRDPNRFRVAGARLLTRLRSESQRPGAPGYADHARISDQVLLADDLCERIRITCRDTCTAGLLFACVNDETISTSEEIIALALLVFIDAIPSVDLGVGELAIAHVGENVFDAFMPWREGLLLDQGRLTLRDVIVRLGMHEVQSQARIAGFGFLIGKALELLARQAAEKAAAKARRDAEDAAQRQAEAEKRARREAELDEQREQLALERAENERIVSDRVAAENEALRVQVAELTEMRKLVGQLWEAIERLAAERAGHEASVVAERKTREAEREAVGPQVRPGPPTPSTRSTAPTTAVDPSSLKGRLRKTYDAVNYAVEHKESGADVVIGQPRAILDFLLGDPRGQKDFGLVNDKSGREAFRRSYSRLAKKMCWTGAETRKDPEPSGSIVRKRDLL